uniref:Core Histone H2A/H2B/H3 domain-containing protein n=1 Tax=Ciona savignyi TaxID=51511 RepID=H2YR90_CIOSA
MPRSSQISTPGSSARKSSKSRRIPTPSSGSAKRKSNVPKKKSPVQPPRTHVRPGAKTMQEIRKMQTSSKLCIRKLPFSRLVREIQYNINPRVTCWQSIAIQALHEAAEAYLVRFLEDCNLAAKFTKRVTVMAQDTQFVRIMRLRNGIE